MTVVGDTITSVWVKYVAPYRRSGVQGGGNMPIVMEEKSIIKASFDDDINDKNLCVNGKKVVE